MGVEALGLTDQECAERCSRLQELHATLSEDKRFSWCPYLEWNALLKVIGADMLNNIIESDSFEKITQQWPLIIRTFWAEQRYLEAGGKNSLIDNMTLDGVPKSMDQVKAILSHRIFLTLQGVYPFPTKMEPPKLETED